MENRAFLGTKVRRVLTSMGLDFDAFVTAYDSEKNLRGRTRGVKSVDTETAALADVETVSFGTSEMQACASELVDKFVEGLDEPTDAADAE